MGTLLSCSRVGASPNSPPGITPPGSALRAPRGRLSLWAVPLLVILVLCLARPAAAQLPTDGDNDEPPVAAVIPFGVSAPAQPAPFNQACERALSRIEGLKVVTAAQWEKEAKDSGAGDDLEAMARRLGADVLVTGTLSQGPDGWKLAIDVFDEKAQPVQSAELVLYLPQIGPAAQFRLEELLERIVRPAVGLQEKKKEIIDSGPEPTPQDTDREAPAEVTDAVGTGKPPPPPPPRVRAPWEPIIEAHVGVLAQGRTLSCGAANPMRLNQPCTEPQYPLDAGGGVRLQLSFFPFSIPRVMPAALVGLGIDAVLEAPFWAGRKQQGTLEGLPVHELRFEGGLRWRWNIGNAVLRPILEAGLHFGLHDFSISGGSVPYPNVSYRYLLPTLGVGSFFTRSLHARASASLVGAFDAGDANAVVDNKNQNPFGPGSTIGFRVLLEGQYMVYKGVSVSVGGYVERMSLFFDGSGCTKLVAQQTVCDASIARMIAPPEAVSGASDLYLSGWINLGYRY